MKYSFKLKNFLVLYISAIVFFFTSCEKDKKMAHPDLTFTVGAGYTSADTNIARNTVFKIGVTAKQTENKDSLETFNLTFSPDGTTGISVNTDIISLTGRQKIIFTKEYNIRTLNEASTGKYTFVVITRNGLITAKIINITTP
jgi:hypothetical protein